VERIVLTAEETARLPHRQSVQRDVNVPLPEDLPRKLAQLIDVLTDRLGAEHVTRIATRQTHLPERAFAHIPAGTEYEPMAGAPVSAGDQPSLLYDTPEVIEVIAVTPDGPPSWLRWRGEAHRVATATGPQRIGPQWWTVGKAGGKGDTQARSDEIATRDYFKVQLDSGAWLWVYRQLHPQGPTHWFAHGQWA
jgi:protein ImuB